MTVNALNLLKPKIRVGNSEYAAKQFQFLMRSFKRKSSSRYAFSRGACLFFMEHTRDRRVIVKVSYAKNSGKRSWAAHGSYLQREHAQELGRKGLGFGDVCDEINLKDRLRSWQQARDPHFFKIILSPENADKLDLKSHTRELMEQVSRDLNTKLEWIAIDHHNTDQGHVHILLRGIDEKGKDLTIDPNYISDGIRKRSQSLVTLKLGMRTQSEMHFARAKQIQKEYVTEIDRALRFRAQDGIVSFGKLKQDDAKVRERRLQDIQRLKFLETLHLAERVGEKIWRLSPQLESTLKAIQLSNDIIKSRAQHGLSIAEYPHLLNQTEFTSGVVGRVVGSDLETTPKMHGSFISSAIDFCGLTEMDRCLRLKSREDVVSFEKAIPYSSNVRKQRLQEIERLKFLESLSLCEKIGAKQWRLVEGFEKKLMQLQPKIQANQDGLLSPTMIDGDHPLTGKVVGMGLDNELHDRRYILIEGLDGKIHYVRATEGMVQQRDQFQIKKGEIISLKQQIFYSEDEKKSIPYIQVRTHGSELNQLKDSVFDEVIISNIKAGLNLQTDSIESRFGSDFLNRFESRLKTMMNAQILFKKEEGYQLHVDHPSLLDDLQHSSYGSFEVWQPHLNETQKPMVGKVIESNERVMLVQDVQGSYFQVKNGHLGIDHGLKVGSELYLRKQAVPNLQLTNTDQRLVSFLEKGCYSPSAHTQALTRLLEQDTDRFFLKSKEDIQKFVLAHQRRADTWVKWEFLIFENGVYRMNPEKDFSQGMTATMTNHLAELKKQSDLDRQKKPCLFTVLKEKTLKVDKQKFVLMDRMLADIQLPKSDGDFMMVKKLRARQSLWLSRGIKVNEQFEQQARQWLQTSQTLNQVQDSQKLPLLVVRDAALKNYTGTVVSMGSCDHKQHTYLVLKNDQSLLALMMRKEELLHYQLNQSVSIPYRYRNFVNNEIQKQKKISLDTFSKG